MSVHVLVCVKNHVNGPLHVWSEEKLVLWTYRIAGLNSPLHRLAMQCDLTNSQLLFFPNNIATMTYSWTVLLQD